MKWQPIETAPTGCEFLVSGGHIMDELGGEYENKVAHVVRWSEGDKFFVCNTCQYGAWAETPTHWMPLPEPPEGGE